jgi:hypothetical protein
MPRTELVTSSRISIRRFAYVVVAALLVGCLAVFGLGFVYGIVAGASTLLFDCPLFPDCSGSVLLPAVFGAYFLALVLEPALGKLELTIR